MARKCLWYVAVLAAAAIVWDEYRLSNHREPAPELQPVATEESFMLGMGIISEATAVPHGEEESEVTVIDLTWLQRQTAEPPVADTEEPAALPAALPPTLRPQPNDLEIPADF